MKTKSVKASLFIAMLVFLWVGILCGFLLNAAPLSAAAQDENLNVEDPDADVLETTGGGLGGGNYYLDGNITLRYYAITINGDVTIDLRGHTIDRRLQNNPDTLGYVFRVTSGCSLTIKDSAGGGTITGGNVVQSGLRVQ